MKKTKVIPLIIILGILVYFFADEFNPPPEQLDESYLTELENYWQEKNDGRINGYLQLIALSKLTQGETSFGKAATNTLQYDLEGLPPTIATITLSDSLNVIKTNADVLISIEDGPKGNAFTLEFDEYGSSQRFYHERINWQIVTRSDVRYLRVWDTQNPAMQTFKGYNTYDVTSNMIIDGEFTYYDEPKDEIVKSEVDGQRNTKFIGQFTFEYKGDSYSLDVGGSGFTMVSDGTTGNSTYGGGRYIYLNLPEKDGSVTIDFNKLYNPPCAFNEYTTCLYPPRQNYLPFNIEAGETTTPIY